MLGFFGAHFEALVLIGFVLFSVVLGSASIADAVMDRQKTPPQR